jgi:hypothetical protein
MVKPDSGRRASVLERDEDSSRLAPPSLEVMAANLQQLFGQKLTAFMAGTDDPKEVGKLARGEALPSPAMARRLADAHSIAELLLRYESPQGVCSWFLGMNPELDDRAPAEVLGDDPDLVRDAAHVFIATG